MTDYAEVQGEIDKWTQKAIFASCKQERDFCLEFLKMAKEDMERLMEEEAC